MIPIFSRSTLILASIAACGIAAAKLSIVVPSKGLANLAVSDVLKPFRLTGAGGVGPYRVELASGSLPTGLSLKDGALSGKATRGGPYRFSLRVTDSRGRVANRAFSGSVYAVPTPVVLDLPYYLSCAYMPKPAQPSHQWSMLRAQNEQNNTKDSRFQRYPLLGYYKGTSSEVLDWQIKMAVERGIRNFTFDDYWVETVDHPVFSTSLDAFLNAHYSDRMTFCMLFNGVMTSANTYKAKRSAFLTKVLPYYVQNYFSRPNYLRVNGRPVIHLLSLGAFFTGDAAQIKQIVDAANEYIRAKDGADGAYWMTNDLASSTIDFSFAKASGMNGVYPYYVMPYVWPWSPPWPIPVPSLDPNQVWPTGVPYNKFCAESVARHEAGFQQAVAKGMGFVPSANTDLDSRETFWQSEHIYFNGQTVGAYQSLLQSVRGLVDRYRAGRVHAVGGKPLVGLGAWNEQAESSSIEPGYSVFQRNFAEFEFGDPFVIANTAAMVFGAPSRPLDVWPPDYSPPLPYGKTTWTFSSSTGAGLEDWEPGATAGVSLGRGAWVDSMVASAPVGPGFGISLMTPAYVDVGSYPKVKVQVAFDANAAAVIGSLMFHWRNTTYPESAHLFGSPNSIGRFYANINPISADVYTVEAPGWRTYTFNVGQDVANWVGVAHLFELRFLSKDGIPGRGIEVAVKRMWLEH